MHTTSLLLGRVSTEGEDPNLEVGHEGGLGHTAGAEGQGHGVEGDDPDPEVGVIVWRLENSVLKLILISLELRF